MTNQIHEDRISHIFVFFKMLLYTQISINYQIGSTGKMFHSDRRVF